MLRVAGVELIVLAGLTAGVAAMGPSDPAPPPSPVVEALSTAQRPEDPFLPSRHGFAFANSFTGSPMPPELRDAESGILAWARGMAERHIDLPEHYGLCGGMSLLAADYYLAGKPIPTTDAAPASGTPLYDAIYARQRDSLGPGSGYVFKFSQWMALPDVTPAGGASPTAGDGSNASDPMTIPEVPASSAAPGAPASAQHGVAAAPSQATADAQARPSDAVGPDAATPSADAVPESTSAGTRLELPPICRDLEAGNVVPLGLVLTRARRGRLWNNHQVLAYAVTRVDDATLDIHIYDPNYPRDDRVVLRVEGQGVGTLGLEAESDRARALRHGDPSTRGQTVRTTRLTSTGRATNVRGVFRMPYEPQTPRE